MNDHRAALKKNLFDLPTGWSWHWLTDVISIQGGTQPPANTFSSVPLPGYVRLVQIRDFETDAHVTFIPDSKKWRKCGEEDILIARYGAALGRICKGLSGAYNVALAKVVPSNSVDSGFIYQLLRSSFFQDPVLAMGGRSAQAGFNKDGLSVIPVPIPPLPEQRAIAATLGALDDKIELNRKMNATLEAMARALFRDWFVDFGPTRAKMEGGKSYLSPELWSLFPDRLDSDGKPEGWETGTLGDLATLNPESWSAKRAPAGVRYVDLANTKWGTIDKIEEYDWADAPSRARRILRPGDTIVGTVRPGNGSFAHIGEDGLTGSTGFAVLRPNDPRDRGFVWCAATSPENIDRLAHLADGGAYPAVRPDAVAGTEIVIPDAPILAAFDEIGRAHLDMMEANKRESRTLARTRDLLLPRLMSGELRVAEAETLASEVA